MASGTTVRKVPILGSIPILGWLFKKKDTATRSVELLVFLRPRITRSPQDAKDLLREVRGQMPTLNSWLDDREKEEEEEDKNDEEKP